MSDIDSELRALNNKVSDHQLKVVEIITAIDTNQKTLMKEADRREKSWVNKIDKIWDTLKEQGHRLSIVESKQINFKWLVVVASGFVISMCASMISWYAAQPKQDISTHGVVQEAIKSIPK